MTAAKASDRVAQIAEDYYDSADADAFYAHVWGGEDIHIGIYERPDEPIFEASRRTVATMAKEAGLRAGQKVLDIGAGYGGAARWLASQHDVDVTCLNLSTVQNRRNRALCASAGLAHRIEVVDGSFEAVPAPDAAFDAVWSEDAILHSGDKAKVFAEVARVLKPGGPFVFTDPMQADDCPPGALADILARIHLDSMGSVGRYREMAAAAGLKEVRVVDHTQQLTTHYQRVHDELSRRRDALLEVCSEAYLARMQRGLMHWVEGGAAGHLFWGILHFERPA